MNRQRWRTQDEKKISVRCFFPSLMSVPQVTLHEKAADFAQLEMVFYCETQQQRSRRYWMHCSQAEALAHTPMPVFAKSVTYDAKNEYFSVSFLELFEQLQREHCKPAVSAETAQTEGKKDPSWSPSWQWCRNYYYELLPKHAPCHLYFDIDGLGTDAAVAAGWVASRGLVFAEAMVFVALLALGLVYCWCKGVLRWR